MRALHADTAATYTLNNVSRFDRVTLNGGVDTQTVTVRHATTDDDIAVIKADTANEGTFEYGIEFDSLVNLEVVLSGATDVTVVYE